MTFANPLPWWAFTAVVCAAAGIAWIAYSRAPVVASRRATLGALRLLTLLLLLVLWMRPVRSGNPDGPTEAIVPILVDTSRSMGIEDAGGKRRIDRARELLERELLPALGSRFRTEVLAFGEGLTRVEAAALAATARRSDLSRALNATRERYRGRPVAGLVILSDGGETGPVADAEALEGLPPVFALGIGSPSVARDREVLSVTTADAVLDDSRVDLAVSAVSHGYGATPVELRLLENGAPLEVRRVAARAEGVPIREVFKVTASKAATVYTVQIPLERGELVPENNSRSVLVQPPSRPRRILLVQGAPGFEHSFLRRAWNGDRGLEIDSVVRKGRNDQGRDTFYIQAAGTRTPLLLTGYPQTAADLFAYDAIVLANVDGGSLGHGALAATREFVSRRGGGLLVLGAHSFVRRGLIGTPLEDLLPLDPGEQGRGAPQASARPPRGANRVALTAAGETHPIMQLASAVEDTRKRWESVPALASTAPLGGPKPGATVLAVTSGPGGAPRALVAVQRFGEGRSMLFTGEASWRWRMMLPAEDRSYDTFWRQAIRWLSLPAADAITVSAPADAVPGDVVPLRISVRDAAFEPLRDATVRVRVTAPDGRVQVLPAAPAGGRAAEGTFEVRVRAEEPGVHRATAEVQQQGAPATTAGTALLVGGADSEMSDPRLNLRTLQRLTAASGGRMIESGGAATLATNLRDAVPDAVLSVRRDLWHNGWSFATIMLLMTGEWILRRRWGLR